MQNHYNFVFDDITNTYNFVTKNNILYRVAFIVDETFSTISGEEIPNIFQLIIEKASNNLEPYDAKVSKTIEYIIEQFFHKIENSLIYVYSDDHNKALTRYKVFDRWYKNSKYREVIVKIDDTITIHINKLEVQKIHTSFLFHKQNSNYKRLIEIYEQIEKALNEEK